MQMIVKDCDEDINRDPFDPSSIHDDFYTLINKEYKKYYLYRST